MKKALLTFSMALLMLVLAACGGASTPEPVPTEPPVVEVEPTAEPETQETEETQDTEEVPETEPPTHTPDPDLIDVLWAWEQRDPNGTDTAPINVANSERYTLFFNEDGSLNAGLDCNNGVGDYTTSAIDSTPRNISMTLGAVQSAFCGEESLDMPMMQMFDAVQTYEFAEEGTLLLLRWADDGPVDYFRRVEAVTLPAPEEDGVATGTVIAADGIFLRRGPGTNYPAVGAVPVDTTGRILGVNDTGEWWLALAPSLPGGQVWVAAQFVSVTNAQNVPVVTAPALGETLVNVPWEWVSTTDGMGVTTVPNPENYVIIFNTNETAAIKADCNAVQATYTAEANTASLTLGASTRMACGPDSLGDLFVNQLSQVTSYFVEGGNLYLELPADSGTMRFVPQGTPLPTADAPAGEEAEGQRFYVTSFGGQPILPGTEITADFNNATVSGNAGCNNYSAPLLVAADGTFSIGPAAGTLQFCAEPEGVMEQEQAFLLALSSTQAYQWERSQAADGSFVVQGQFSYVLDDGTAGVINFTTSP